MPNLTSLTVEELRSSTKNEIIDSIKSYLQNNFTKKEIIRFLRDKNSDTEWSSPICTYFPDGQIESQTEIETDDETGLQVSKKIITFSYYNTGEINKIITQILDENNVEKKRRTIKHYRDGKDPEEI